MTTQANIVKIDKFEAFELYKYYNQKWKTAKEEGFPNLAESFLESAQKWIDVASEIQKNDTNGLDASFETISLINKSRRG